MAPEKFLETYVGVTEDGENLTILSKPDQSCILLDGTNKCMVNDTKPDQCSGFPNTWFFEGWQDMCGAILINEKDFDKAVSERDKNF